MEYTLIIKIMNIVHGSVMLNQHKIVFLILNANCQHLAIHYGSNVVKKLYRYNLCPHGKNGLTYTPGPV